MARLDFNHYLNAFVEVQIGDRLLKVRQPSIAVNQRIKQIEVDLTTENMLEKRLEVLKVLLDNNIDGEKVTIKELSEYPVAVAEALIEELGKIHVEALTDPN